MRLHAEQGFRGTVYDRATGRPIPKVLWVDLDTGELEALAVDDQGHTRTDGNGNLLTVRYQGNFGFQPRESSPSLRKTVRLGAPYCRKCGNPLTLPGEELCPPCHANLRSLKISMKVEPLPTSLLNRVCDHPGCQRPAAWSVSDEVEVTPQQVGSLFYRRGATVNRYFYCTFHWRPPRLLDARGEEIERFEDGGGVRPD